MAITEELSDKSLREIVEKEFLDKKNGGILEEIFETLHHEG
jgi:hypothetical protein